MKLTRSILMASAFLLFITSVYAEAENTAIQEWNMWRTQEVGVPLKSQWNGKTIIRGVPEDAYYWLHELELEDNSLYVEAYWIEKNSDYYSVIDGVLFSKDLTILYKYPPMRSNWYYMVPSTVLAIEENAFCDCYYLQELVIPGSVTYVGAAAFDRSSIKRIHFPPSILQFDIDAVSWMPHLEELVVKRGSVVYNKLMAAREYIDFFGQEMVKEY